MWTSLCNFLCNKLFRRPERGFRHSGNDFNDGIYRKRLKLVDRLWDSNGSLNPTKSCSMLKENVGINGDDEDCCIIAEIPRRKKPGNSIAVQNLPDSELTTKHSQPNDSWSLFVFHENSSQTKAQEKDIENVKVIRKFQGKDVNNKTQTKKFFNTERSCLSSGKLAKSRLSFRNQLKRKMNFLQESYRLTEKLQYMQLLQSHTSRDLFSVRPSSKNIRNEKQIEVIDLSDEKTNDVGGKVPMLKPDDQDVEIVREISGVRSFQDILKIKPLNAEIAIKEISSKHRSNNTESKRLPEMTISLIDDDTVDTAQETNTFEEKFLNFNFMKISSPDIQEVENKEPYYLPELTFEQEKKIENALIPEPSQEVLSKGFGLQITRQDMQMLKGLNWLNDEIINFYMNLIMERSKMNKMLPKVYAFNTFFYPKLVSNGYTSLKRWTKQVDIFSFDIILVPIHLGMHWCLSVIDFRSKSIRYYDSVGSPNDLCLKRLLLYLKDESLDKKEKILQTNNWKKVNVEDIPQQMNGGDCGVFSCMFAEHLARNCSILFTQDDMSYFRRKMVIEILEKKLLT